VRCTAIWVRLDDEAGHSDGNTANSMAVSGCNTPGAVTGESRRGGEKPRGRNTTSTRGSVAAEGKLASREWTVADWCGGGTLRIPGEEGRGPACWMSFPAHSRRSEGEIKVRVSLVLFISSNNETPGSGTPRSPASAKDREGATRADHVATEPGGAISSACGWRQRPRGSGQLHESGPGARFGDRGCCESL